MTFTVSSDFPVGTTGTVVFRRKEWLTSVAEGIIPPAEVTATITSHAISQALRPTTETGVSPSFQYEVDLNIDGQTQMRGFMELTENSELSDVFNWTTPPNPDIFVLKSEFENLTEALGDPVSRTEFTALSGDVTTVTAGLAAEITARGVDVDAEQTARIADVDAEETRATGVEAGLDTRVTTLEGASAGSDFVLDIEADFGAVGDGVTDDTGAFQDVIDLAVSSGDSIRVRLHAKTYAVTTLVFPTRALTNEMLVVEFVGAQGPPQFPYAPGDGINMAGPTSGSIILGDGSADVFNGGASFRNFNLHLTDVIVRMPANPSHSAVNARFLTGLELDNVLIDVPGNWGTGITQPTHSASYGLDAPGLQNSGHVRVKDCTVVGYYTGIRHSEHFDASSVTIYKCIQAVQIARGYHSAHYDRLMVLWCPTPFVVDTSGSVGIPMPFLTADEINFEDDAPGNWWSLSTHFTDATNLLNGVVTVHRVLAGVGVDTTIVLSGAANLRINEQGVPSPVGVTSGWVLTADSDAADWAAPPAGGGGGGSGAIAQVIYNPAITSVNASGSVADVDSTHLKVTFDAPATGAVIIVLTGVISVATGDAVAWGVSDHGSFVAEAQLAYVTGDGIQFNANRPIYISGLTPTTSYTFFWTHHHTFGPGTDVTVFGGETGPAIIQVYEAP